MDGGTGPVGFQDVEQAETASEHTPGPQTPTVKWELSLCIGERTLPAEFPSWTCGLFFFSLFFLKKEVFRITRVDVF